MSDVQPTEGLPEAPVTDRELAAAQLEGADPEAVKADKEEIKTGTIDFRGEKFHVAEEVGIMPMMLFAASADLPTEGTEGLAAIWRVVEDVLHEEDVARFTKHALTVRPKVQIEELLDVLNKAQEIITGNPTEQQDGSSTS